MSFRSLLLKVVYETPKVLAAKNLFILFSFTAMYASSNGVLSLGGTGDSDDVGEEWGVGAGAGSGVGDATCDVPLMEE